LASAPAAALIWCSFYELGEVRSFFGGTMITLSCVERTETSKGGVRRLRREGLIPAVVYSKGNDVVLTSVSKGEFEKALRNMQSGFLTTTVFVLTDKNGKGRKTLVREVQYHPTSYEVIHIDFMEMDPKREITVKIPVEMINTVDCIGSKLGGQLRYVTRHIKVRCLPSVMPSHFAIDVKDVNIRQSRRVKDIVIPAGVTCLTHMNDVVITVNK
jgi:large subunit ribosomal protein L25